MILNTLCYGITNMTAAFWLSTANLHGFTRYVRLHVFDKTVNDALERYWIIYILPQLFHKYIIQCLSTNFKTIL